MTYKKSSVNKAKKSDFINCLKTLFVFPLLSMLATLLLGLSGIITNFKKGPDDFQYILFTNEFIFESSTFISLIALIVGIITAVRAFAFLRKVPSTNVYLSLPITRYDLYKNRIFSFTIYSVIASLLPIIILMATNYALFKPTKDFPLLCLYFITYLFVHLMLGFAVGSLTSVSVGKRNEASFFSLMILLLPRIILSTLTTLQATFANGAAVSRFATYAAPTFYQFSDNISNKLSFLDPLRMLYEAPVSVLTKGKKFVGFDFKEEILPLIIFGAVTLIIIVIVPKVFEKRLAENADAVGVSKGLNIMTSFLCSIFTLSFVSGMPPFTSQIILTILALILSVLVYFIVYAILTRNKQKIVACLKKLPLIALIGIVFILATIGVGKLYYSNVPKVENIKSAYAVASGSDIVFKSISSNPNFDSKVAHDTIIGEITDKDDLKLVTDIHKQVTKELYRGEGTFKVLYIMKDGSTIARTYYNVGKEATKQTYRIYDTKAYNNMLKYRLTVDPITLNNDLQKAHNEFLANDYGKYSEEDHLKDSLLNIKITKLQNDGLFVDGLMYLTDSDNCNSVLLNKNLNEEQISALKLHLYNDISKMNYEEKLFNNKKPIYYLSFVKYDDYYNIYNDTGTKNIDDIKFVTPEIGDFNFKISVPIYSNMNETINYLDSLGIKIGKLNSNDIVKAEYFEAKGRFDSTEIMDIYITPDYKKVKDDAFFSEVRSKGLNDFVKDYARNDYPNMTQDKSQIEALYSGSLGTYQIIEDNGLIVKFETTKGEKFTAYVPQNNVPDFAK